MQVLAYTNCGLEGITALRLDTGSGEITCLGRLAAARNATFLAVHPGRRLLFAVDQFTNFQGKRGGAVSSFAIAGKTGQLRYLNTVSSRGPEPCFISVDRGGRNVLVANYSGGNIAVLPIGADGCLSPASDSVQHRGSSIDPVRQSRPYAHSINASPDDRFVIAADLGLDELLVYRFDSRTGSLLPNDPSSFKCKPGSGPRHLAFHPGGRFAYVIHELRSEVTALHWDSIGGSFTEIHAVSTIPRDFSGENSPSEISVHPNGRFLYASNRGHDSIAVFEIDSTEGTLEAVQHVPTKGQCPRSFALDPSGAYLLAANQGGNIAAFCVDALTGRLDTANHVFEMELPVCIRFANAD